MDKINLILDHLQDLNLIVFENDQSVKIVSEEKQAKRTQQIIGLIQSYTDLYLVVA